MKHFPIFLSVENRAIVVSGGGDAAIAKLRLLLKTTAEITVFAEKPAGEIRDWASEGRITLVTAPFGEGDAAGAVLVYAANDDDHEDDRVANIARAAGVLVNHVDNLEGSDFITPAIVDRDPVTVAIGTEGAAPVLARAIKAELEERLPRSLGPLARIGKGFRAAAEALPMGRRRRAFWSDYYFATGPRAYDERGKSGVELELEALLARHIEQRPEDGHVTFVGAGPGDPELLTLKARRALHEADVVIHDRLVSAEILELARREAVIVDAGKEGFGPSTPQGDIDRMIVDHARKGLHVVRLKSGDATVFGRLDEEIDACNEANVAYSIVPGITSASASVAAIGQSLTRRGRNSSVRFMTGHDVKGFAEHDWKTLARPGEVAAIYMGKRSARFLQGRLMMHGARPDTPVTLVVNVSRPDQSIVASRIGALAEDARNLTGPALILYGLEPRAAVSLAKSLPTEEIAL